MAKNHYGSEDPEFNITVQGSREFKIATMQDGHVTGWYGNDPANSCRSNTEPDDDSPIAY